ncbi:putative quinol monooxygenase [Albidovulum sp.]|uniref:putative quinol monooxygenase n=1 Tax=Albidovulum sp. TaxID=1872424 RepID=UPI0039B92FE6
MSATGPDRRRRPGPRLTLSGFLLCRTLEEADRVAALLPEHTRLSRAEAGCLRFEVWRSHADPCRFAVTECFRDRAAFDAHQARSATTVWARATKGIPRDYVIGEEGEEGDQLP